MATGLCSECGEAFEIKGRRIKTCSPECSIHRGGRHVYRVVTKPTECSECGAPVSHRIGGKRLTCSSECGTERTRRIKREQWITLRSTRSGRTCVDCPQDISSRRVDSIRCPTCQDTFRRTRNRKATADRWGRLPVDERARRRLQYRLKTLYGIGLSDYEAMVELQGGLCAICGNPPTGRGRTDWLVVDHDHITSKTRSLLCGNCNCAIGLLNEDPEVIKKAVRYLARWAV